MSNVKKFKDYTRDKPFIPPCKQVSYKDSLIGNILGAYAQDFSFDKTEENEEESNLELKGLIKGIVDVKLSKETKA